MFSSERLVADELDRLGVTWQYEPRLFALAVDASGNCTAGFQPDFYLPDHDLYIEVTQARILTPKNRKLRLLAEQHPTVRAFLICAADFERLAERVAEILHLHGSA